MKIRYFTTTYDTKYRCFMRVLHVHHAYSTRKIQVDFTVFLGLIRQFPLWVGKGEGLVLQHKDADKNKTFAGFRNKKKGGQPLS